MSPGDQGQRKGLCAGCSVTDLQESFWEDGGRVRGEGRPVFKKVPFPPHVLRRIKKGGRKTGRLGGEKGDIPRWGYPLPWPGAGPVMARFVVITGWQPLRRSRRLRCAHRCDEGSYEGRRSGRGRAARATTAYRVAASSTVSKASMMSPILTSLKFSRPTPHSLPLTTSRASSLKRLRELILPV